LWTEKRTRSKLVTAKKTSIRRYSGENATRGDTIPIRGSPRPKPRCAGSNLISKSFLLGQETLYRDEGGSGPFWGISRLLKKKGGGSKWGGGGVSSTHGQGEAVCQWIYDGEGALLILSEREGEVRKVQSRKKRRGIASFPMGRKKASETRKANCFFFEGNDWSKKEKGGKGELFCRKRASK